MRRIAIVGVGLLGSAVASRLLAAGFSVAGYDIDRARLTALEPLGLRAADGIADAVTGADAVFTILTMPAVVEAVWLGPGGVLETAPADAVLMQTSTVGPGLVVRLGEAAQARGVRFLDAPVSGTSAAVAEGQGTIFLGGDPAVVEAGRPVFEAVFARHVHVGAVGTAAVAKLAANMIGGIGAIVLAEALVLGAKAGVEPAVLLEALRQTPVATRTMDTRGALMVKHEFPPFIRLDLFLKDFHLMLEEGARLGVPLPLTSVAHQLCTATSSAGRGGEDLAAVITTLERLAGLQR